MRVLILVCMLSLVPGATMAPAPVCVALSFPVTEARLTFPTPLLTDVLYASREARAVVHASFTYTAPFDFSHQLALPSEDNVTVDVSAPHPVTIYRCDYAAFPRIPIYLPLAQR